LTDGETDEYSNAQMFDRFVLSDLAAVVDAAHTAVCGHGWGGLDQPHLGCGQPVDIRHLRQRPVRGGGPIKHRRDDQPGDGITWTLHTPVTANQWSDTLISTQSVHSVVLIKYYKN